MAYIRVITVNVWMRGWRDDEGGDSRIAETPAQAVVGQGELGVVGGAQGYPVHIGPRLGAVTGVEVSRHSLGMGDPEGQGTELLAFRN